MPQGVADHDRKNAPSAAVEADWIGHVVVGLVAVLLFLPTHVDPDLWGHIRYGLDILQTRSFTPGIVYGFTENHPFTYHEWLGGVLMAIAYRSAGTAGLVILKLGILTATVVVLARTLRTVPLQVRIAALVIVLWSILPMALTVRPQLWSMLCVAILLALLRAEQYLWGIPVVLAFWANLHGGWIVGAGLVTVWACYQMLIGRRPGAAGILIASALASLLTPYGVELWQFILSTVRLERGDVQEWQPLWTAPVPVWGPWLITALTTCVLSFRGSTRPRLDRLVSLVMFGYASLFVVRLVEFFVIIGAVYLTPSLVRVRPWRIVLPSRTAVRVTLLPIPILVGTIFFAYPHPLRTGCMPISGEWAPDLVVGAALENARPNGRLALPFNWGQYAIWHLGPTLQVSIDGRRETVYTETTTQLQHEVTRDSPVGRRWLMATKPEFVWMPQSRARAEWLRGAGYRIDVETPRSVLGVRMDQPPIEATKLATVCFPG